MTELQSSVVAGVPSGLLATIPMTATMWGLHKLLPMLQRDHLPPRKITMRLFKAMGIGKPARRKNRKAATAIAHFAYGALAGGMYGALRTTLPAHQAAHGPIFGLAVWAGSYLGWLPAIGIWMPQRETRHRLVLMIAAHLVWGTALGFLHEAFTRRR